VIDAHTPRLTGAERIIAAVLFGAVGLVIVAAFSPWVPLLTGTRGLVGRIGLMVVLLSGALLAWHGSWWNKYWRLLYSLFVLLAASSADWFVGNALIRTNMLDPSTPRGMAFQKLNDGIVIVAVVLLLTRISGASLGSIYVQKGKLRQGIIIGVVAFAVAAAVAVPISQLMFKAQDLTAAKVLQWSPWILLFVLSNATGEEIMFRGLFLRKLELFLGPFLANCLICPRLHRPARCRHLYKQSDGLSCGLGPVSTRLGLHHAEDRCSMGLHPVPRRHGHPDHPRPVFDSRVT